MRSENLHLVKIGVFDRALYDLSVDLSMSAGVVDAQVREGLKFLRRIRAVIRARERKKR